MPTLQALCHDGPVQSGRVVTSWAMIVGSAGPLLCWELGLTSNDINWEMMLAAAGRLLL